MNYYYNLGRLFKKVSLKNKNNIALLFSLNSHLSYQEYDILSNKMARYFLDHGIKKADVVCVSGEKHISTYIVILACLKIGAIYSIFDPNSPIDRLNKIILKCDPKIIFSDSSIDELQRNIDERGRVIFLSNNNNIIMDNIVSLSGDSILEAENITGSDGAYIMFTSGSTGFPKGVLITHNNLLNFIAWSAQEFNIRPGDRATNVNPLFFDNSVFDFYTTIFNGATLVPIDGDLVKDPARLIEKVDELKCTQWFSVPSLLIYMDTLKAFNKDNMKSVKRIIFGGEGFPKKKLKLLYALYGHKANFYNVYGPTECTCMCSSYIIQDHDLESTVGLSPLGKIAQNFDYIILKDKCIESSDEGELCLIGPCVGSGYYNDSSQTKKAFVQNPLNTMFRQIMYRTGDIVHLNGDDGYLYFVTRKDNQIKHMGYRVELEEIESAANSIDYINESSALHGYINNNSRIYLVLSINIEVESAVIKNDLRKIIPEYMIPSKVIIMKMLPKNANGKIDRNILKKNMELL